MLQSLHLIQAKGNLSLKYTCLDLYSCLSILCALCQAAYGAIGHLSVLCSAKQLPTHAVQCWAASNAYYSDSHIVYIVFVLFVTFVIKII